jgi:hypothetical protein
MHHSSTVPAYRIKTEAKIVTIYRTRKEKQYNLSQYTGPGKETVWCLETTSFLAGARVFQY